MAITNALSERVVSNFIGAARLIVEKKKPFVSSRRRLIADLRRHQMKPGDTRSKCPKCGGNLYFDRDYYVEGGLISWYEQEECLQCGYISYEVNIPLTEIAVTTRFAGCGVREK